jgi:hypothetical protein
MQRSNSGKRTGTNAMVRTIHDYENKAQKNKTVATFKAIYEKQMMADYPDMSKADVDKSLNNNIEWGKGNALGTLTDYKGKMSQVKAVFTKRRDEIMLAPGQAIERAGFNDNVDIDKTNIAYDAVKKGEQINAIMRRKKITPADKAKQLQDVAYLESKNMIADSKRLIESSVAKLDAGKNRKKAVTADLNKMAYISTGDQKKMIQDDEEKTRERLNADIKLSEHISKKKQKSRETHEKDMAKYNLEPRATRGAVPIPNRSDVAPIQPKEFEDEHAEEKQYKKITRKNVGKIDLGVKVEDTNVHVKPNVKISDIQRGFQKQKNRLKLTLPRKIVYHKLNSIAKQSLNNV